MLGRQVNSQIMGYMTWKAGQAGLENNFNTTFVRRADATTSQFSVQVWRHDGAIHPSLPMAPM
jgi:hypothetical protein